MQRKQFTHTVLVLLLALGFLAAQFHFCADLGSGPAGSHICPICSHAGAAISANSPGLVHVPLVDRLESRPLLFAFSSALPRATSPRAPPAL
jgi:hypothetical protein